MSEKKSSDLMIPPSPSGGILKEIVMRLKLIIKLMADPRVNIFWKLLPIATLVYLVSPIDLAPIPIIGALDDAAIIWLGNYLFIELCPPNVVAEHLKNLTSNLDIVPNADNVVDAESTDVSDKQ